MAYTVRYPTLGRPGAVISRPAPSTAVVRVPVARPSSPAIVYSPTPQRPANPPLGYYDPTIDYQETQAQRNYGYLLEDQAIGGRRASEDYAATVGGLQAQLAAEQGAAAGDAAAANQTLALRDRYADEDFTRGSRYNTEDFNRAISDLARNYSFLGHRQEGQARQMGVAAGGAEAQSAARRTENQAHDRQPIDTAFQRRSEELVLSRDRTHEMTAAERASVAAAAASRTAGLQAQIDQQIASAGRALERGSADDQIRAQRALQELADLRITLGQQRWAQAAAAGYTWQPPAPPAAPRANPGTVAFNPTTRSPYAPGGRYGGMLGFPSSYSAYR